MKIFKWSGRILISAAVLALIVCGVLIVIFSAWKKDRIVQLEEQSQVIQTDAGPVEFAESGDGPAILILHGAPGGYDQSLLIGQPLADDGFRIIAPSRPGYLRTPLESGLLFDEQAKLMGELLNSLKINKTIVVGFSTGASVAVEFARLYPNRTRGLVLISPVTQTYNRFISGTAKGELLEEKALMWTTGDMGAWALAEGSAIFPEKVLRAVLEADTDLGTDQLNQLTHKLLEDPNRLQFFQKLLLSQAPLSGRESGTRNDLLILKAINPMELSALTVPTLVVVGSADATPEWTPLETMLNAAPGVRKVAVENAGRLVWLGSKGETVAPEILSFIRSLK